MKLSGPWLVLVAAALAQGFASASPALARMAEKGFVVSFGDANTPDSVITQAKNKVKELGGQITHSYTLIKGFSARGSVAMFDSIEESVAQFASQYRPSVEEDQMYTIQSRSPTSNDL